MKTKIRQTKFSPRGNILGLIDAAQLQRRSTDAVMIPDGVLTPHLGYSDAAQLQRRSSDAVIKLVLRCCLYWPNRSGWRQKVVMPLRTFMLLSWWCPLGQCKGHLPAREDIIMDQLIPILTHLSSHWTVPLKSSASFRILPFVPKFPLQGQIKISVKLILSVTIFVVYVKFFLIRISRYRYVPVILAVCFCLFVVVPKTVSRKRYRYQPVKIDVRLSLDPIL